MPTFASLIEDFLAGLGAAKRSQHTLDGYRNDLLGIAGRIAVQLHGPDASAAELDVAEVDQRAMRRGFGAWASDHSEGSLVRAWGVWNRFFTFLVDEEILQKNPMRAVPKPKLPADGAAVDSPREPGRGYVDRGRRAGSEREGFSRRLPSRASIGS